MAAMAMMGPFVVAAFVGAFVAVACASMGIVVGSRRMELEC